MASRLVQISTIFCVFFVYSFALGSDGYTVYYGTHRTIATIVKVKTSQLDHETVVGRIDDQPLTARRLVELYDQGSLRTLNSYPYPDTDLYFSESKAASIIRDFEVGKFFNPERDMGLGIYLSSKSMSYGPFKNLISKGSERNIAVSDFIAERISEFPCPSIRSLLNGKQ